VKLVNAADFREISSPALSGFKIDAVGAIVTYIGRKRLYGDIRASAFSEWSRAGA
jgi:hypothetical protein